MVQFILRSAAGNKPELKLSIKDIDLIINERHGNPTVYMKSGAAFKADRPLSHMFISFARNNDVRDLLAEVPVLHPDTGGMDRRSADSFITALRC